MPFVARTPQADRIEITYAEPPGFQPAATEVSDPWNSWIFRLGANGSLGGEERSND